MGMPDWLQASEVVLTIFLLLISAVDWKFACHQEVQVMMAIWPVLILNICIFSFPHNQRSTLFLNFGNSVNSMTTVSRDVDNREGCFFKWHTRSEYRLSWTCCLQRYGCGEVIFLCTCCWPSVVKIERQPWTDHPVSSQKVILLSFARIIGLPCLQPASYLGILSKWSRSIKQIKVCIRVT